MRCPRLTGFLFCLLVVNAEQCLLSPAWSDETFSLVLVGDTGHGENYQEYRSQQGQSDVLTERGYDAPLAELKPLLDGADYVIANLETPVVTPEAATHPPYPSKDYSHWTDPRLALPALRKAGINAVSLANNHAMDYATDGLNQTLDHLAEAEIHSFGAGRSLDEASRPLSIQLPPDAPWSSVEVIGVFEYRKSYDENYAFYAGAENGGTCPLDFERLQGQIATLKARQKAPLVIVYPHWGSNYKWRDASQIKYAEDIVSAGADLVVGHGAHMIQEIEVIGSRSVFFSLGNFMFLSNGRYKKLQAPPYSAVLWLEIPVGRDSPKLLEARLYPIVTDNLRTDFRSRPVDSHEFDDFQNQLRPRCQGWSAGTDQRGHHLTFMVETDSSR